MLAFARAACCSRRPPLQASGQFCESGGICARMLSRALACLHARCSTRTFALADVTLAFQILLWSVQCVDEWFFEAGKSQLLGLRCHLLNAFFWRRLDSFPFPTAGSESRMDLRISTCGLRGPLLFGGLLFVHMVWVGLHTRDTSHLFAQPHVSSVEFACLCAC